jgi:hypothetical protein
LTPFKNPLFDNVKNPLRIAIIFSGSMLFAIAVYLSLLYILIPQIDLKIFSQGDAILTSLTIILAASAILTLKSAYYFPKIHGKKFKKSDIFYLNMHIIRVALCGAVGIYGLILGVCGAAWYVSLPFLVISAVALIIYFPTSKRWAKFISIHNGEQ